MSDEHEHPTTPPSQYRGPPQGGYLPQYYGPPQRSQHPYSYGPLPPYYPYAPPTQGQYMEWSHLQQYQHSRMVPYYPPLPYGQPVGGRNGGFMIQHPSPQHQYGMAPHYSPPPRERRTVEGNCMKNQSPLQQAAAPHQSSSGQRIVHRHTSPLTQVQAREEEKGAQHRTSSKRDVKQDAKVLHSYPPQQLPRPVHARPRVEGKGIKSTSSQKPKPEREVANTNPPAQVQATRSDGVSQPTSQRDMQEETNTSLPHPEHGQPLLNSCPKIKVEGIRSPLDQTTKPDHSRVITNTPLQIQAMRSDGISHHASPCQRDMQEDTTTSLTDPDTQQPLEARPKTKVKSRKCVSSSSPIDNKPIISAPNSDTTAEPDLPTVSPQHKAQGSQVHLKIKEEKEKGNELGPPIQFQRGHP